MSAKDLTQFSEHMINQVLQQHLKKQCQLTDQIDFIYGYLDPDFHLSLTSKDAKITLKLYQKIVSQRWQHQQQQLTPEQWHIFNRLALLKSIDQAWINQVDNLQVLKVITQDRSVGQRQPILEYQEEAQKSYEVMRQRVYLNAVRNLLYSEFAYDDQGELQVDFP